MSTPNLNRDPVPSAPRAVSPFQQPGPPRAHPSSAISAQRMPENSPLSSTTIQQAPRPLAPAHVFEELVQLGLAQDHQDLVLHDAPRAATALRFTSRSSSQRGRLPTTRACSTRTPLRCHFARPGHRRELSRYVDGAIH